ncbi:type IV pilus modification protein PilV [Methyloversatilis thermotolerans]|uniref:type IV pilus modification protein PilV n=1 Tax=Methyloversatilis thermotolerans TaxID=1346290 RepID=UPI0003A1FCFE|nr:type IV pilus modification protein PilV [Methyloversatilis thermotolerans]
MTRYGSRFDQQGVSLIEVLVALFVLAFGMLGIAGLQTMALKANQSAFERNSAIISTTSIIERMRNNRAEALKGSYNRSLPSGENSSCTGPTGNSTQVERDIGNWLAELSTNLGTGACGAINCSTSTLSCAVTVQWDDSRVANGSSTQTFSVEVGI